MLQLWNELAIFNGCGQASRSEDDLEMTSEKSSEELHGNHVTRGMFSWSLDCFEHSALNKPFPTTIFKCFLSLVPTLWSQRCDWILLYRLLRVVRNFHPWS